MRQSIDRGQVLPLTRDSLIEVKLAAATLMYGRPAEEGCRRVAICSGTPLAGYGLPPPVRGAYEALLSSLPTAAADTAFHQARQ